MGILESSLRQSGHGNAEVLGAGHGFYSPLQCWLLMEHRLQGVEADVVILNFYTGNDFYDMLRRDDRPHYVEDGSGGYAVAPPSWVAFAPPQGGSLLHSSRILSLFNRLASTAGLDHLLTKSLAALSSAWSYDRSPLVAFQYLDDLRRSRDDSLWYPGAASAQALNQALYFEHYHGSQAEAMRRTEHLLRTIRRENPDLVLVLSLIPSRVLAGPRSMTKDSRASSPGCRSTWNGCRSWSRSATISSPTSPPGTAGTSPTPWIG